MKYVMLFLACLLLGCQDGRDNAGEYALGVCADDRMTADQVEAIVIAIDAWNGDRDDTATTISDLHYDMPSVIMHELGHALGFDHTDDPDSVMFAAIRRGEVRRTPMGADFAQFDDDGALVWFDEAHEACDVHVAVAWADNLPTGKIGGFAKGRVWINPAFPWTP